MGWEDKVDRYGKQVASTVTVYDESNVKIATFKQEETAENQYSVISVNPHYDGALYASLMREMDIELEGKHSYKGMSVSVLIGVKSPVGTSYDYANYGTYFVKESEYDVATDTTKLECYDRMLQAMIPYDLTATYPLTVSNYLKAICTRLGWSLTTTSFVNSDIEIEEEKFDESFTFRDVLDQIAQVVGGILYFSRGSSYLSVRYPMEKKITVGSTTKPVVIDESNLKSLTIGKKFGPVNSLVLARTPQEDNIFTVDESQFDENGNLLEGNVLCEVKIENNLIMDSHRDDFIEPLFEKIKGTTYYVYELESFGIGYLDIGDIFTIKTTDGTEYKTIMLNDDLKVTQGMSERASFSEPDVTETDYSTASKTDRLINQTMLKVDKQEGKITALVSKTGDIESVVDGLDTKLARVEKSVEQTVTAEAVETLISEKVKTGTTEVTTTTGYKFDKDGLHISKSDSEMSTTIDEDGMDVSNGGEKVLVADSSGVNALNLAARQFLMVGSNSRFEDYNDGTDSQRTGCFFIGG